MVQNQWYHFGIGAPPILVYFSGDWDVHWGYRVLTNGHIIVRLCVGNTIGTWKVRLGSTVLPRKRLQQCTILHCLLAPHPKLPLVQIVLPAFPQAA